MEIVFLLPFPMLILDAQPISASGLSSASSSPLHPSCNPKKPRPFPTTVIVAEATYGGDG